MKIVINGDYGGFGIHGKIKTKLLSLGFDPTKDKIFQESFERRYEEKLHEASDYGEYLRDLRKNRDDLLKYELGQIIPRNHPALIKAVESFGGSIGDLCIVEIPDDVKWFIVEFDGKEHIAEKHRTWRCCPKEAEP